MATKGKKDRSIWDFIWSTQKKDKRRSENLGNGTTLSEIVRPPSEKEKNESISNSKSGKNESESQNRNSLTIAREAIFDIENMLKEELANLDEDSPSPSSSGREKSSPKKYTPRSPRRPKKRPGPRLIRPLSKRKSRMVVGDMVFDPARNIWIGNEKDLAVFQRPQPALITNRSKNQKQVVGQMEYDPVEKVWKGNEKDLAKFKSVTRPALITQPNRTNEPIVKNGMIFDPVEQKWKGNEESLVEFEGLESDQPDTSQPYFKVGTEFTLSPEVIANFKRCEEAHIQTLKGWFPDREGIDRAARSHLNTIRHMSIVKIISLAKQSPVTSSTSRGRSHSLGEDAPKHLKPQPMSISAPSTPKKIHEEDWDDVDIPHGEELQLRTRIHTSSSSVKLEDLNLSEDNDLPSKPKRLSLVLPANDKLAKFQELDEDDSGIGEIRTSSLKARIPSGDSLSSLNVQMGSDDDEENHDNENHEEDDGFGEEEEDDKELKDLRSLVPQKLAKKLQNFVESEAPTSFDSLSESDRDDSKSSTPLSKSMESTGSSSVKQPLAVEDWSDVEIPKGGLKLKVKSIQPRENEEDEFSGVELPNGSLRLRPRAPSSADEGDVHDNEEENWSDVDLPDSLLTKLKNLSGKTVTEPIVKQNLY